MTTTKKSKRSHSKASKGEAKKQTIYGWDTTDEHEIEIRKLRAKVEDIIVNPLDNDQPYFGSFLVYSSNLVGHGSSKYLVEIRSLLTLQNSCSCADFKTNRLGTCKHIERVLLFLQKQGKRKFKQAAQEGSARAEICLLTTEANKIMVLWPQNINPKTAIYKTISNFFSSDDSLIGDPLTSFTQLKKTVEGLRTLIRSKIRISAHTISWVEKLQNKQKKQAFRSTFTADIRSGKRSLDVLKYPLYQYQQEGLMHLLFNERALLADEMGLGKTIQAIAACKLLKQIKGISRVLVVATASLKTEWEEQIAKFSDLTTTIIQGPRQKRLQLYQQNAFFYLTNYEQIRYDGAEIQRLMAPDVIILDEAQRIKNWQTKTATAVKKLSSPYAFVLTGTPLENRIDDIYSVVQFLDPNIFGSLFRFNRQFYCLDERGRPTSYKNLDELHRKLKPVLLRRRKRDVEDQLPERTINNYFVSMDPEQTVRYDEYSTKVARLLNKARKRPLRKEEYEMLQRWLACMRMLCDTPYILDKDCRISPKLHELEKILQDLLTDNQAKVLIFSEWTSMLQLVKELAQEMKLDFAWHIGAVPQHKRRLEINRFKEDQNCRLFLSSDSGSVGLNLQAANIVINIDMPWNPAKLEQRIARAWRKHQKNTVQVINLVSENTIEHRMLALLKQKTALAENILHNGTIKEMNMPSGKAAFMERLESLMDMPMAKFDDVTKETISDKQKLEQFQNDLLGLGPENLISIEKHSNPQGKPTLLTVVENNNQPANQDIHDSLHNNNLDKLHNIAVIDKKTQEAIKKLADLGIITINQPTETLFEAQTCVDSRKKLQMARIQKARKHLVQIERKQSMAKLLVEGGFYQEASVPLIETATATLAAYGYVKQQLPSLEAATTINEMQNLLRTDPNFPTELLNNVLAVKSDDKQIDEVKTKNWLKTVDSITQFVEEALNKSTLS